TSRSIFVNERWSNTKPAPSVPRITFVTGSHLAVCGWSNIASARSAYGTLIDSHVQNASTWQSSVSVSRLAGPPHDGHSVLTKLSSSASGRPVPSILRSVGSTTGSCSFGTGTIPQPPQYTIGIGAPQLR